MSSRPNAALVAVALGVAAARGFAQPAIPQTPAGDRYTVTGTVADPAGTPVADVDVSLIERDSATRLVRTDQNGRFRMSDLAAAEIVLRVRRLGYQVKNVPVRITGRDRSATVFVTLEQSVASLDPVHTVDADSEAALPDARLVAFHQRAQTNSFGRYITEAMIAKAHTPYVSDLMRTLPGVTVRPTRVVPGSASKIGNTVRFRNCGVQRESPEANGPLVWLDGVRMPGAEIDEVTQVADVAAIEVYPSLAGIPAQYFDRSAACGTILVWTKNR
jgi:hypothetical protein